MMTNETAGTGDEYFDLLCHGLCSLFNLERYTFHAPRQGSKIATACEAMWHKPVAGLYFHRMLTWRGEDGQRRPPCKSAALVQVMHTNLLAIHTQSQH